LRRKMAVCLLITVLLTVFLANVSYAQPYRSYTYNYWGDPVPAPLPYLPSKVVDGEEVGAGGFNDPMDLFVSKDNLLYIADTGNNRIVAVNEKWEAVKIIDGFLNNGEPDAFNNPRGVFVADNGHIYVADTENFRIVELDGDGVFIREIGPPESDAIPKGMVYRPSKLVLDKAYRIYVVALSVNQGLIELDADGCYKEGVESISAKRHPGVGHQQNQILEVVQGGIPDKKLRREQKQFIQRLESIAYSINQRQSHKNAKQSQQYYVCNISHKRTIGSSAFDSKFHFISPPLSINAE
jgi:hypothetical protein